MVKLVDEGSVIKGGLSCLVTLLRQKQMSKQMIFQWPDSVMYSWRGPCRRRWLDEAWGYCPVGEQHGKWGLWLNNLRLKKSKIKINCVKQALWWREKIGWAKCVMETQELKLWQNSKTKGVLVTHL